MIHFVCYVLVSYCRRKCTSLPTTTFCAPHYCKIFIRAIKKQEKKNVKKARKIPHRMAWNIYVHDRFKVTGCLAETRSRVVSWNINAVVRGRRVRVKNVEIEVIKIAAFGLSLLLFAGPRFSFFYSKCRHRPPCRTGNCKATNTLEQPYSIEVALLYSKDMGKNHTQEFS